MRRKKIQEVVVELQQLQLVAQQKRKFEASILNAGNACLQFTSYLLDLPKKSVAFSEAQLLQIDQALADGQVAIMEAQKALERINALLVPWELRLNNLSAAQRQFVKAHYRDGKSLKVIQDEFGMSSKQLHRVQQQALNLLRELA